MTTEQIREMLQNPAYEFLRSNEHLKGKIIFLTLGGSYSYGTEDMLTSNCGGWKMLSPETNFRKHGKKSTS